MPTPPEAYANSVQAQPDTQARLRPADYGAAGETIARAGMQAGQDVQQVAGNLFDIQKTQATTLAQEADNTRTAAWSQKMAEFKQLQGRAAVEAARTLPQELDAISQQVAGSALKGNGYAAKLYNNAGASRKADLIAPIYEHAAEQGKVWNKAVHQTGFDNAVDQAVLNYADPKIVGESIATAGNHGAAILMADGVKDPELLKSAQRDAQGKAILKIAEKVRLEQGALAAQDFVKAHADLMNATDANDQELALAPAALKEDAKKSITGHIHYTDGTTDTDQPSSQYYPGDGRGAPVQAPPVTLPDHRETPINLLEGHSITSGFGHRAPPLKPDGTRGSSNHEGLDLNYHVGTPVPVVMSGIAHVHNQGNTGYGLYVDVDHGNGLVTRYGHLSKADVTDGQVVRQGQTIALSGQSGGVAPHLHFEVRQNGNPVDPQTIMGKQLAIGGHNLEKTQSARVTTPTPGTKTIDLQATLNDISSAGFSPMKEEAMEEEAKSTYSENNQFKANEEDTVRDHAAAEINALPDPLHFTSTSQFSATTMAELQKHPQVLEYYNRQAASNAETLKNRQDRDDEKAKSKAAEDDNYQVGWLALHNPDGFARIDFQKEYPGLTPADRVQWEAKKLEVIKSATKPDALVPNAEAMRTEILRYSHGPGRGMTDKEAKANPNRVENLYQKALALEQQFISSHKRQPNPTERSAIAQQVTMAVVPFGQKTPVPLGELRGGGRADERETLRTHIMLRNGGHPVSDAYLDDLIARAHAQGINP